MTCKLITYAVRSRNCLRKRTFKIFFFGLAAPKVRKHPTTAARAHFQTFLLEALGNENQSNQDAPYPSWLLVPTFLLLRSVL